MLSQFERIIKLVCLILAVVLLFKLSRMAAHSDPLANITVPAVPTLATTKSAPVTNTVFTATNAAGRTSGTNSLMKNGTNLIIVTPDTRPLPLPRVNSDLSKVIQARIELISQSEILGPVVRPLPMALLGIAGNTAFFRAPDGQTGMLKEGEELGGVKLLRIGINRILVEQEGEKKELTIFEGYGGQPLL